MLKKISTVPSPKKLKEEIPISDSLVRQKALRDKEIKNIIAGRDNRKLVIIGPCSADNEDAVCDYVNRLAKLSEEVNKQLMIIPRIYTGKPRTKGEGYKGIFHSPKPGEGTFISAGLTAMRQMLVRVMAESGLGTADEMLYPENYDYVDDLLSYITVGARSSENQHHREVASGIDVAIGIKNPMNGSLTTLLNSIYAAQIPSEFKYRGHQVKADGNEFAHAILRGAVDRRGNNVQNYHYDDVVKFVSDYEKEGLKNPGIIIDVNHSNSDKKALEQIRVVKEILFNLKQGSTYTKYFKGFLIESYIEDGRQEIGENIYGKSITDECLGWEKTKKLIYEIASSV
ncbi:MAG: 3-deoxy-7-phosphoheptulonate synthase [Firmicutes bacterium]|nr:3-deoxy-7-phosphoheptulonate synthase [Bacillota bacterium]